MRKNENHNQLVYSQADNKGIGIIIFLICLLFCSLSFSFLVKKLEMCLMQIIWKKTSPGANCEDLNILEWMKKPWFLWSFLFSSFIKVDGSLGKYGGESKPKGIPEPRKKERKKEKRELKRGRKARRGFSIYFAFYSLILISLFVLLYF